MKERSKLQNTLLMFTLFFSTTSIMGDCVVSVITSRLYEMFDAWAVNLMISGPCLAGLVACPIAGRLCDKIYYDGFICYG